MPTVKTILFPWVEVAKALYRPFDARKRAPVPRILFELTFFVVLAWFVTVPVHELLHAAGCVVAGGDVTELTVQPMYGGTVLARLFDFVTPGGEYAGQLTGFDTGGSDVCYFVTVCFPFILTIVLGMPSLSIAARSGNPALHGIGAVHTILPVASLTGDYYEMGSILTTRLFGLAVDSTESGLVRGDDLFLVISRVREAQITNGAAMVALGVLLGICLVVITLDISLVFARAAVKFKGKARTEEV